ncbi:MAG: hypothetical protein ACXWP5_02510 [Bdellovibrionota bacterium]
MNPTSSLSYYTPDLEAIENSHRDQLERQRKAADTELSDAEDHYNIELKKRDRDVETAITEAKNDAKEIISRENQANKSDYDRMKDVAQKLYDRSAKLTGGYDPVSMKKQLQDEYAFAEAQRSDYEQKMNQLKDIQHQHLEEHNQDVEREAGVLRDAHNEETGVLREQVKELTTMEKDFEKKKGEALAKVVKDNENEWLMKQRVLNDVYQRQIDKQKLDAKATEQYLAHLGNQNLKDKDLYFAKVIQNSNQNAFNDRKELEENFKTQMKQYEVGRAKENQHARESVEGQIEAMNEARAKALEAQAHSYQDTIARVHQEDNEQISSLQKALHEQKTSDDPFKVSPAAEAQIRKSVINEYQKNFDVEHDRNFESYEHLRRNYRENTQDMISENETRRTMQNQQFAYDKHNQEKEFLSHEAEAEMFRDATLRGQEQQHGREDDALTRNFGVMMERQKREYEAMLEQQRAAFSDKIAGNRQDADFNYKMAMRQSSLRMSDMAQSYERKMADAKVQADIRYDDLKTQAQQDLREEQRRGKLELEGQAKGYEQRIAQLQAQQEEHERYISQNFNDEIERQKRANALLAKKKG